MDGTEVDLICPHDEATGEDMHCAFYLAYDNTVTLTTRDFIALAKIVCVDPPYCC